MEPDFLLIDRKPSPARTELPLFSRPAVIRRKSASSCWRLIRKPSSGNSSMKLVFHNPHVDIHFGETLLTFLTRSRSFKKEKYLISYILKNKKDYLFYVDGFDSSLPSYIARFFPKKLEIYLWALINKIP